MPNFAPVPAHARDPLLDVMRGLALCVVLVANTTVGFSGSVFLPETSPNFFLGDSPAGLLFRFFIGDRAMTVMTILFGLGFSVQIARAESRGGDATAMFLRRLAVMFALGVCHVVLLWDGDVLWLYGLAGLILLPCRGLGTRTLVWLGLSLATLPRVLAMVPAIGAVATADTAARRRVDAEMLAAMATTDYGQVVAAHVHMALVHHGRNLLWILPWFGGRFLLGFVAGRAGLFDDQGARHLALFRKLIAGGLAVAAVDAAVRLSFIGRSVGLPLRLLGRFLGQAAIVASVAAGVSLVVFAMRRARLRRLLSVLAPVGRMPLTTYLSQSLISTFLFYGWGLGLSRHVQGVKSAPIALGVFALQIALSTLWLRRYQVGPVEWLWRTLAYGRRQPMRLARPAPSPRAAMAGNESG